MEFSIPFNLKTQIKHGRLNSLDELVLLKEIEQEVIEFFEKIGVCVVWDNGTSPRYNRMLPGFERTEIIIGNIKHFNEIKTIINRDTIINTIIN